MIAARQMVTEFCLLNLTRENNPAWGSTRKQMNGKKLEAITAARNRKKKNFYHRLVTSTPTIIDFCDLPFPS